MSAKRSRGETEEAVAAGRPQSKKPRKGFRVGPENLPDGPWRRKVDKVKKNLIVQAKVKKHYAKLKAKHEQQEVARRAPASAPQAEEDTAQEEGAGSEEADAQIHPDRQAMLDGTPQDAAAAPPESERDGHSRGEESNKPGRQRPRKGTSSRQQRPGYFDKSLEQAAQKKAAAEAREREFAERQAERDRRRADRDRYRKAMAKAREPGADGKRRLGRESQLLLERVKKMVGDKK
ncbi:hypothetical protein GQ53DRAFT_833098 [Thozetella sp. PMI_491]|nr:hypothetical protein GQ53DRAFT_833098 [Thozetella sp. PMI_491]